MDPRGKPEGDDLCERAHYPTNVMAGLDPAIHDCASLEMLSDSTRTQIKASLIVRGFNGSPSQVSSAFGLSPVTTWEKDDLISGSARHRSNGWKYDSSISPDEGFEEHAQAILHAISINPDQLRGLGTIDICLFFAVFTHGSDRPAMQLSPATIHALSALDARLDIDLYPL